MESNMREDKVKCFEPFDVKIITVLNLMIWNSDKYILICVNGLVKLVTLVNIILRREMW